MDSGPGEQDGVDRDMKTIDCRTEKYPTAEVLVDDEDFEWLSKSHWTLDGRGYARRSVKGDNGRSIFMHREIMGLVDEGRAVIVDHRNGNPLDNRRENLRLCTSTQNACNAKRQRNNTSGYKGVSWNKRDRRWHARIGIEGKNIFLGGFHSPEKAHQAYCEAAARLHKEFANSGVTNLAPA